MLSMLGLARRAGRISFGHDMAEKSVKSRKSRLLIFCGDSSQRLYDEFKRTAARNSCDAVFLKINTTMNELYYHTGIRAGVVSVDDENFSKKIISLSEQEEQVNGN